MPIILRPATLTDLAALEQLIAASAWGLAGQDYSPAQINAALGTAWGVDTQIIRDGTYFAAETQGQIVGCGGWSGRQTLFGGDEQAGRQPKWLNPSHDDARIRAFFVHPQWARQGIGTLLLHKCEAEARAQGFGGTALLATLPGRRLYQAYGYAADAPQEFSLPGGLSILFVPMRKDL